MLADSLPADSLPAGSLPGGARDAKIRTGSTAKAIRFCLFCRLRAALPNQDQNEGKPFVQVADKGKVVGDEFKDAKSRVEHVNQAQQA